MKACFLTSVEIGNKYPRSGNHIYWLTPHTPFNREAALNRPAPQLMVSALKGAPIMQGNSSEEGWAGSHFMKNLDLQVMQQAAMWLEQDRCVWLCTVLATVVDRLPSPVAEFFAGFVVALGYEVIAEGGCHDGKAIVALTHDPRMDDLTLQEAVRTSAFYIGAMGSRRTSEKRLERVKRIGALRRRMLERIHAPIGLNLGSKTPAEIALAVMEDIVRLCNGVVRDQL